MDVTKVASEKKLDLDEVLDKYGIFHRYHLQIMFLAFFAFATNAMHTANFILVVKEVKYSCKDDLDNTNYCSANFTHSCSEWYYDDPNSFVAYFQLACQEWKRTLVGTVHSFGYMCGLLIVGPMSDRFGRKIMIVTTGVLGGCFGILKSFSPCYWFFIAMEFFESALGDSYSPMYMLIIEIVSSKKRIVFYLLCNFGYIFGGVMLALSAWLITDWKWFLRAIYLPPVLFLTFIYLLDESPRWLLTKGRKDKAVKNLEKAANKNKILMEKNDVANLSYEVSPNIPFNELLRDTFKSKMLRKRFFVCVVWWTASTFINFGLLINSVTLEGNKYVNLSLTYLVKIPGNLVTTYALIHFKRKVPLMLSFFAGGILCVSQPLIPHLPWLSVTFYMAGKLMCSFFFGIIYLYTSELFPTYTRNSMHALCSSLGRIGAIIAPQTPLLVVYWSGLPSLVFGLAALIASMTTFLVPDVSDDMLPDTIHQAESLEKSKIPPIASEACNERNITRL